MPSQSFVIQDRQEIVRIDLVKRDVVDVTHADFIVATVGGEQRRAPVVRVPVDMTSCGLLIFFDRQTGVHPVLFAFLVLGNPGVTHGGE